MIIVKVTLRYLMKATLTNSLGGVKNIWQGSITLGRGRIWDQEAVLFGIGLNVPIIEGIFETF